MDFNDFKRHFSDVQVCFYEDKYEYAVVKTECGYNDPVFFKMTAHTSGDYYITVN